MTHNGEVDHFAFGQLTSQVKTLEIQVSHLQSDMKELLALANKSRGGFWAGMAVASFAGAVVSWVFSHLKLFPQ